MDLPLVSGTSQQLRCGREGGMADLPFCSFEKKKNPLKEPTYKIKLFSVTLLLLVCMQEWCCSLQAVLELRSSSILEGCCLKYFAYFFLPHFFFLSFWSFSCLGFFFPSVWQGRGLGGATGVCLLAAWVSETGSRAGWFSC